MSEKPERQLCHPYHPLSSLVNITLLPPPSSPGSENTPDQPPTPTMPITEQPIPPPEPRIGILEDWLARTKQALRAKGQLAYLFEARGQVMLS
ncbi:hypothetical protein L873DRAFT_1821527 [Choiromyces venosus 120613-1]|uniref:Uncharacterized protein n=1 Tax=Choiromyces venosus 120613-1 TaxID=1336337 RepID=A0A3N4IYW8_9PEZI|nr:hypothetical protein L873DRAFT_1821527 [Choiromyces venosus 120613-1]